MELLETLIKRLKYFQLGVRVAPRGVLGTKGIKLLLLCYSGPLKSKKSFLFHLLPVTLRKTVEKPNFAKILRFLVEKGGSQAGVYPISTPAGSRRVPLLSTPLFLLGKRKITAQSGFPTVSRNCNWKKVKQKTIVCLLTLHTVLFKNT